MVQIWLRPNYRVLLFAMSLPTLSLAASILLLVLLPGDEPWLLALRGFAWLLLVLSLSGLFVLCYLLRIPRLGYDDGHLLLYLRSLRPIRVPIEVVECFFFGHAPTLLPRRADTDAEENTKTVVVRLAEAATEWHHQDVQPALGHWCDGYVTIRGTWCEPLNAEVIGRLNQQLIQTQRQRKIAKQEETA